MQVERLPLDMASQIQQFYNWLMENTLKATEISLWHSLMHIADKAGYPIWLSVAVTRLEKLTGMKKDAIYNAREKLQEEGLIEIQLGKGNQAAQYRLIPFEQQQEPEKIVFEELPVDDPVESEEEPPIKEEQPILFYRRSQEIIPMPPSKDTQWILQLIEEGMEDDLVCEGIDITLNNEELKEKNPMDRWKYFNGIIRTWFNNGISTLDQYKAHEKEREERLKNGGNKQGGRTIQPETRPEPKANGLREFRVPGQ